MVGPLLETRKRLVFIISNENGNLNTKRIRRGSVFGIVIER